MLEKFSPSMSSHTKCHLDCSIFRSSPILSVHSNVSLEVVQVEGQHVLSLDIYRISYQILGFLPPPLDFSYHRCCGKCHSTTSLTLCRRGIIQYSTFSICSPFFSKIFRLLHSTTKRRSMHRTKYFLETRISKCVFLFHPFIMQLISFWR